MKYIVFALALLTLQGCNIQKSDGTFNGRVVDVEWSGIINKSCEIDIQVGQQSSKTSDFATRDEALCADMKKEMGQVVTFKYRQWLFEPWGMNSSYEILR